MKKLICIVLFFVTILPLLCAQHSGGGLEDYVKAESLRAKKQYSSAISHYDKAIEKDPSNYKFFIQQGKCYFLLKRIDEAIACLQKAASLKPDHVESYLALSKLYGYKGNTSKSIQYLSVAAQHETNTTQRLSYRLHILKLLYAQKDLVGFPIHLDDAKNLAPQNPYVWYFSSWYHNQIQEYAQAIIDAERGLKMLRHAKEAPRFYFQLGYALYQIGEYSKANECLQKANVGSFKEQVFRLMPQYKYRLAEAYHQIFDYPKAKKYVQEALLQDPKFTQASELATEIAVEEIDHTLIIERIKEAIKYAKDYDQLSRSYADLALLQFQNENFAQAISSADSALKINPLRYDVRFLKAITMFEYGQHDEAINEVRQLTHLSTIPASMKARFTFALGVMYRRLGKSDFAIQYFKKVTFGSFRYAAQEELEALNTSQ